MTGETPEEVFVDALAGRMRSAPLARRIPDKKLSYLAWLISTDAQAAHKLRGASPEQEADLVKLRGGLQLAARAFAWRLGLLTVTQVEPIPRGEHGEDRQMGEWFGLDFADLLTQVADLDDPED